MWCGTCHREVATVPANDGGIHCPFCGRDLNEKRPAAQWSTGTGDRLFRTDSMHSTSSAEIQPADSGRTGRSAPLDRSASTPPDEPFSTWDDMLDSLKTGSWINLAGFFVVLFLLGQSLAIWAFLTGHFGAWALGQLSIGFGVACALWLLVRRTARLIEQQRQMVRQIGRLQHRLRGVAGVQPARSTSRARQRNRNVGSQ